MGRKNAFRTKRRNARTRARLRKQEYGKLFNGNVYAQGEFVFIWGLILALLLGLWFYIFSDTFPITDESCTDTAFVVTDLKISEDGTVLREKNISLRAGILSLNAFPQKSPRGTF